jgi:FAD/FMN-containing dehydrogenase
MPVAGRRHVSVKPPLQTHPDLRSWGRVHRGPFRTIAPRFVTDLPEVLASAGAPRLAIGARRSYGDTGLLGGGVLIDMTGLDRFESFDESSGLLTVQAGAQLGEIMATLVGRGWFPPVTPGTRFVTVGGAVANDVHGKNHHRAGAFGRHVSALTLRRSDEPSVAKACGPGDPLFSATIGGLGLTGVIESVSLRMQPIQSAWLDVEKLPMRSLEDFFSISADSGGFEHTVAWIDCTASGASLGRGVFSRADWRRDGQLQPHREGRARVPREAPAWLFNPLTLKAFNALYGWAETSGRRARAHYASVFHPLDAVAAWNLLYGAAGFYQYQCLVPEDAGREPVRRLLKIISDDSQGSILAVLKTFGDLASPGLLSFPAKGCTLALDFPNRGQRTLELMARLDQVVLEAGGRLYPAKDGRMDRAMFEAGYPALEAFRPWRDPACQSDFSNRMGL